MVYLVYFLILATILPFTITLSQDPLVQTLTQWVPKEFGFFIGASLIIAMSMFWGKERINTFRNKWLAALLIYAVIHFSWIFWKPILSIDIDGRYAIVLSVIRPFLNIFLGIILIKTLVENLSSGDWVKVSKFLCWTGFILAVYSIFQWFGFDQIFGNHWKFRNSNDVVVRKDFMMTFLSNHILSSNYIALLAPLCLMFKEFRYKIFFATMAISVCMADSLTSFVALAISIMVYLVFCARWRVLLLTIILIIVASVYLNGVHKNFFSANSRVVLWKDSITTVLKENPFTGTGIGSYPKTHKLGNQMALSAHNEFVQSLVEGGIFLIIIIGGYFITLSRRVIWAILDKRFIMTICFFCGFLGLFVISNGSFPFRFAPLATLGILYIANLESMIGAENV